MQKFIFSLLLAAIVGGIFGRATGGEFIWNDRETALQGEGQPLRQRVTAVLAPRKSEPYTPVVQIAWSAIDRTAARLEKPSPKMFHTANLAVHIVNTVLVFLILALVLANPPAGFFGALLFSLHPLQVEPVAYVSALGFPLGAMFGLFAVWQYLIFSVAREAQSGGRVRKDPIRHYYLATIGYVLAILAMPALVVLPLAALLFEKLLPRRSVFMAPRKPVWPLVLWGLMGLPQIVWTMTSQNTAPLSAQLPLWIKPVVAADALSFYISKLFAPAFIGPDYGRSPAFLASHWWGFVTWILPTTLFLILLYWRDKPRTWYASAFGLFLFGLLPFLGFAFFEAQGTSTVANRYAYFAMIGPALGMAYAMTTPKKAWLQVLGFAAIVVCGYLSFSSLKHWKNDEALWSYAVKVNPGSPIAHEVLGNSFRAKGDWQNAREHYQKVLEINATGADIMVYLADIERMHGEPQKAIDLYKKALAIDPSFTKAYGSLGLALLAKEEFEGALANFRKAVELEPENQEALKNLGLLYVKKKEYAEAVPLLRRALALADTNPSAPSDQALIHALLGLSLASTNQGETAREHLETALKLDPNHQEAHLVLADIYFASGEFDKALPHYQKAVQQADAPAAAFNNLGIILAMHKQHDKAIESFQKALSLKPDWPEALTNVGMSQFQLRRFTDAQASFERTLELKPAQADPFYFLGDILRWQGKQKEALGHYYRAIKINPNHVDANYRLGNHFMKENNPKEAMRHYQAALKVAPEDQRLIYSLKKAEKEAGGGDTTM